MKKATDWIKVGGNDGAVGTCERCGETLDLTLPMPLYLMVACMKAFVKEHSDCEVEVSEPT